MNIMDFLFGPASYYGNKKRSDSMKQNSERGIISTLTGGLFGRKTLGNLQTFMYKVGLKASSQNPSLLFNLLKTSSSSDVVTAQYSSNQTIAVACTKRIFTLSTPSSDVAALVSGNDLIPVMEYDSIIFNFYSSSNFAVVPFIVLMENGESITATDAAASSVVSAVQSACPAQTRNIVYGPMAISRQSLDSGTKYSLNLTVDLKAYDNAYSMHLRKMTMEERNPLALSFGLCLCGNASQVISINSHRIWLTSQQNPDLLEELK